MFGYAVQQQNIMSFLPLLGLLVGVQNISWSLTRMENRFFLCWIWDSIWMSSLPSENLKMPTIIACSFAISITEQPSTSEWRILRWHRIPRDVCRPRPLHLPPPHPHCLLLTLLCFFLAKRRRTNLFVFHQRDAFFKTRFVVGLLIRFGSARKRYFNFKANVWGINVERYFSRLYFRISPKVCLLLMFLTNCNWSNFDHL